MKTSNLKIASLVISTTMVLTSVGCGSLSQNSPQTKSKLDFKGYPIETSETLTYWLPLQGNVAATAENLGATPFGQELQKRTGINIKFIHPPTGQEKDQFNIMLASDDLPDVVEYDWFNFPGGPEKALQEQYIIKLNDVFKNYSPNLRKYLDANPSYDKMIMTDTKNYYGFPCFKGDNSLVFSGPAVRQDWLDELGLPLPETMNDWYIMLKSFKEKKGSSAPLTLTLSSALANGEFVGAYGTMRGFYVEDGKVKFGPTQPQYKEFLKEFAKWYKEGLIDNNIASTDAKALDANILNSRSGATYAFAGSGITKWMSAMKDKNSKFNIVAAPHIVLNKGDVPRFGQRDYNYSGNVAAITTKCKNVELAARLLDYGYSEEGSMLFNYGEEGVSYEKKNGTIDYTDLIVKNPEKLSISVALCKYSRRGYSGPFVIGKELDGNSSPVQKKVVATWNSSEITKYKLPKITPLPEESSEIANIMNNVTTSVDEMTLRFVMGLEPIENFDSFVATLKGFKIDRAVELYQGALQRYENR